MGGKEARLGQWCQTLRFGGKFALTPALFPEEREKRWLRVWKRMRLVVGCFFGTVRRFEIGLKASPHPGPLPRGEGEGVRASWIFIFPWFVSAEC